MALFYSWHSDTHSSKLLDKYVSNAVKKLGELKYTIDYYKYPCEDKSGSPDIVEILFDKIRNCDCFIADLSPVGKYRCNNDKYKNVYNANVLMELGYALSCLDQRQIIICSDDFDNMPFDVRNYRISSISSCKDNLHMYIIKCFEHKSIIHYLKKCDIYVNYVVVVE
jgi:hypothetical protein